MTRAELIEIGHKIISAKLPEEELESLMELFNKNVTHPKGSSLFFYPEKFNFRTDDIKDYNPTVEEVVDKCLNYRPIQL